MTWQSVGVISPGEMGTAVATVWRAPGLRKDQAALARQLPVQELIPLLAAKGLRQATGGLVQ